MRYYRQESFENLEKVSDEGNPLEEWEAAQLIETLARHLKKSLLGFGEECILEDGRKRWMVRHSKYLRIREHCFQLKAENAKLKEAIRKLTST